MDEPKEYSIALERKCTNHVCGVMKLSEPIQTIRVFEKDIIGYKSDSQEIVEFEITNRYLFGSRIFREI